MAFFDDPDNAVGNAAGKTPLPNPYGNAKPNQATANVQRLVSKAQVQPTAPTIGGWTPPKTNLPPLPVKPTGVPGGPMNLAPAPAPTQTMRQEIHAGLRQDLINAGQYSNHTPNSFGPAPVGPGGAVFPSAAPSVPPPANGPGPGGPRNMVVGPPPTVTPRQEIHAGLRNDLINAGEYSTHTPTSFGPSPAGPGQFRAPSPTPATASAPSSAPAGPSMSIGGQPPPVNPRYAVETPFSGAGVPPTAVLAPQRNGYTASTPGANLPMVRPPGTVPEFQRISGQVQAQANATPPAMDSLRSFLKGYEPPPPAVGGGYGETVPAGPGQFGPGIQGGPIDQALAARRAALPRTPLTGTPTASVPAGPRSFMQSPATLTEPRPPGPGQAAMDALRSNLRSSPTPATAASTATDAAMSGLRRELTGPSGLGRDLRMVGNDLVGGATKLGTGFAFGDIANELGNEMAEAFNPSNGQPGLSKALEGAPNLTRTLFPQSADEKNLDALNKYNTLSNRQRIPTLSGALFGKTEGGPVQGLTKPDAKINVPDTIPFQIMQSLGGPRVGQPIPAQGGEFQQANHPVNNFMHGLGLASPSELMAGKYTIPNPFSYFDAPEVKAGSSPGSTAAQVAKLGPTTTVPAAKPTDRGVLGESSSAKPGEIDMATRQAAEARLNDAIAKGTYTPNAPKLSAEEDLNAKLGLPPGTRLGNKDASGAVRATPPAATAEPDPTRAFLQQQVAAAQKGLSKVPMIPILGDFDRSMGPSQEGYYSKRQVTGYRPDTSDPAYIQAANNHQNAIAALQSYDQANAKTSAMKAETGKTNAETDAISGKGELAMNPDMQDARFFANGKTPEEIAAYRANHPGPNQVGSPTSVTAPVNGLNLPNLINQRYGALGQFFSPGTPGYNPNASLDDIVQQLDLLKPPGYDDPNSELGQVIRQGITQRYGTDLAQQLAHPTQGANNWLEQNIAGPLASFSAMLPWGDPRMAKAWDLNRNATRGRRTAEYWNQLQGMR